MPRLRNVQSGAVMNVSDATAARMGGGWVAADQPKTKKAPTKRATPKAPKSDDDN